MLRAPWLGPDISLPDFIVSTCIYLQPWFMAIRIDDLDQCSHALFLLLVHWLGGSIASSLVET